MTPLSQDLRRRLVRAVVARVPTPTGSAKHTSRGAKANAELTFTADHPVGGDH
jgi:hypothetical protein